MKYSHGEITNFGHLITLSVTHEVVDIRDRSSFVLATMTTIDLYYLYPVLQPLTLFFTPCTYRSLSDDDEPAESVVYFIRWFWCWGSKSPSPKVQACHDASQQMMKFLMLSTSVWERFHSTGGLDCELDTVLHMDDDCSSVIHCAVLYFTPPSREFLHLLQNDEDSSYHCLYTPVSPYLTCPVFIL